MTAAVASGDTIRLWGTFRQFPAIGETIGALADPTSPYTKVYDSNKTLLTGATPTKWSTGIYYLDYTTDATKEEEYIYEFAGTLESKIDLNRARFSTKFVDNF